MNDKFKKPNKYLFTPYTISFKTTFNKKIDIIFKLIRYKIIKYL